MAPRKSTQTKYWSIYEAYLKYASIQEIMFQFQCSRITIWRALKYCQECKLVLSLPEEVNAMIEAKRRRIQRMLKRLDFLEEGWEEESITTKDDGTILTAVLKGKFNPSAESAFYREIRELEKDIQELKGLHTKNILEITGKDGGPIEVKTYVVISPEDWPDDEN